MHENSPWAAITVPPQEYNVRLVSAPTAVPCYRGRAPDGAYLFILELPGDHQAAFRDAAPVVNGLSLDLRSTRSGQQRLVLSLEHTGDLDIFEGLCNTLTTALATSAASDDAFRITVSHLNRWKVFLSGRSRPLSSNEARGLLAELLFLERMLGRGVPQSQAISGWSGPERAAHDFQTSAASVEIKSIGSNSRNRVRISSEDQLESSGKPLFLRIYRLSEAVSTVDGVSLNDLVARISKLITSSDALDDFTRKLAAVGYAPLPAYDEPRFTCQEIISYRVTDDFPRLTRRELPAGVVGVTYDLLLEKLEPFRVSNACIEENF